MRPSWWLVELTPEAAEKHDRRAYSVPEDVGLGWRPYTFRATLGAVAQFACFDVAELERRLRSRRLRIVEWSPWRDGCRQARLEVVGG